MALSRVECQTILAASVRLRQGIRAQGHRPVTSCNVETGLKREFSAGGVLVHRVEGRPVLAAIRPEGKPEGLWALPKGRIGKGERPEETAVREVEEETGTRGSLVRKLGDVRYVYSWKGERIFKVVSFFLLRYETGKLGAIAKEYAHEVADVRWLPLDEAPTLLAYAGERDMARKALDHLAGDPSPRG
jgi:8-oxo-dGTP pyrophosphatase MutT (NUDIX family)